jgi:hypothetical protein
MPSAAPGPGAAHAPVGPAGALMTPSRTEGSRLVAQQTVVTSLYEAFLPAPDTSFRFAGSVHDLIGTDAVRAHQENLSPPDVLMRRITILAP